MRQLILAFVCLSAQAQVATSNQATHDLPFDAAAAASRTPAQKIAELQKSLSRLEKKFDEIVLLLSPAVDKDQMLEGLRLSVIDLQKDLCTLATLSSASTGFVPLRTSTGFLLLLSLDAIESYLDAYKVKLRIGNSSSVTLSGLELNVNWGAQLAYKRARFRKASTPQDFIPGIWTPVEIVLPNTKATEVGTIEFSASSETVSLRK